jgi:hypothetical protein
MSLYLFVVIVGVAFGVLLYQINHIVLRKVVLLILPFLGSGTFFYIEQKYSYADGGGASMALIAVITVSFLIIFVAFITLELIKYIIVKLSGF